MPAPMQNRALKISSTGESVKKTYYFRDAQGNVLATYSLKQNVLTLEEIDIYGSSRLGLLKPNLQMYPSIQAENKDFEGKKNYELSNHLGNVLAVISDRKKGSGSVNGNYAYFEAVTISATDYYPFGMAMPGRTFNTEGYRYGFNGKENDSEWAKQDYGMRISDPRIGRFLSLDPLATSYPWYTPYQFAGNTPIQAVDLDGKEILGYLKLSESKIFGFPIRILDKSDAWNNTLRTTFAAVGQGDGVNAQANKANGRFVGIAELQFHEITGNDPSVGGLTTVMVVRNGIETPLAYVENVKKEDMFRINVDLYGAAFSTLSGDVQEDMRKVITVVHETATHALSNGLLIEQFKKGEIDGPKFLSIFKERLANGAKEVSPENQNGGAYKAIYDEDHQGISNQKATTFEAILNDVQKLVANIAVVTKGIETPTGAIKNFGDPSAPGTITTNGVIKAIITTMGKLLNGQRVQHRVKYTPDTLPNKD